MTVPVRINDHADSAPTLLTDMFANKAKTAALLKALTRPFDGLESVIWDVLNLRQLGGFAYGIHLDWLGKIVGENREGRSDASFEKAIRIRIRVNRSQGQTSDILDVLALWSSLATYQENFPASFEATSYNDPDAAALIKLLGQAKAVTTYGVLLTTAWPSNQTFKFDHTDGSVLNAEFDTTDASLVEKFPVALTTNPGYIRSAASAMFDPATLALSGWWRADFAGSPWASNASAGTSGAAGTLTGGTPPTTGATVNGKVPAAFVLGQALASASNVSSFITTTAWSLSVLMNPAATAAARSVGSGYGDPQIICDPANGYWYLTYTTSGVTIGHYDPTAGAWKEANAACSSGSWHLVHAWFDGVNISISVDSGATVATASTDQGIAASPLTMGASAFGVVSVAPGLVAEVMIAPTDIGSTARASIKTYINARYALAL